MPIRMRRLCLGLLCAALLAGAAIGMTSSMFKSNPLEPETNVDGYEFEPYVISRRDVEIRMTIRLTKHCAGAQAQGYASYGDFELVTYDEEQREVDKLPLNSCFGGEPIGFSEARFPIFQREDKRLMSLVSNAGFAPGFLLAIGQRGFGAPEGYRAYVPIWIDESGKLEALPVEGDYLYAPESLQTEDFTTDLTGRTLAPNGDFMNLFCNMDGRLLHIGQWWAYSVFNDLGTNPFFPEADYVWGGEQYEKRHPDYLLRPKWGGFVPIKAQILPAPLGKRTLSDEKQCTSYRTIYAGAPEVDYFVVEEVEAKDRSDLLSEGRTTIHSIRGNRQTMVAEYIQKGGTKIETAVFDGRYLYWEPLCAREGSAPEGPQRYDTQTGRRESFYGGIPTRFDGGFVLKDQSPGWVYRETATGREIKIFNEFGDWRVSAVPGESCGGIVPLMLGKSGTTEKKLALFDLENEEYIDTYDITDPMLEYLTCIALGSRYAVLSGRLSDRGMMFLLDLQTGERKKIWDVNLSFCMDAFFLNESQFVFCDTRSNEILGYDAANNTLLRLEELERVKWDRITRAYDGETLLAYSEDGSRVVAFTPAA